jgi:hypothetical protein
MNGKATSSSVSDGRLRARSWVLGPISPALAQNNLLTGDVAMDWTDKLEAIRESAFNACQVGCGASHEAAA